MSDAVKGLSEIKREQKGIDANSPGADASSSGANSSGASSADASDNVRYAIIQIDNRKITVLDTLNEPFFSGNPRELLENKLSSIFAIKITKKVCTETKGIKCIEYGDAKYELDLETPVTKDEAEKKLIDEKFLGFTASDSKESEVSASVPESDVSESKESSKFHLLNIEPVVVENFLNTQESFNLFNTFLNSNDQNFEENINNLEIAKKIVDTPDDKYKTQISENYLDLCNKVIDNAKKMALATLNANNVSDDNFDKFLTAYRVLFAIDPANDFFKANVNDNQIVKKLEQQSVNEKLEYKMVADYPNYEKKISIYGYTPKIVERGGAGNCLYYSVWGGLRDLNATIYKEITDCLENFAKENFNKNISFTHDKQNFNTNIRKLLSYCFLSNPKNEVYTQLLEVWSNNSDVIDKSNLKGNQDGIENLLQLINNFDPILKKMIETKCKNYKKDKETTFFTAEEFAIILSNIVAMDGSHATELEVNVIKQLFTHCKVIIDVYSPSSVIDFENDKLPIQYKGYNYIYVRHTGGVHYQQIQTNGNGVPSSFSREPVGSSDEYRFWKYIPEVKLGGSRKTLGPKLKKTKRKYYVYKK